VLSLPLTRRQRYIYFLVDGRRSVSDLSRTTGKTIQEVELVLRELQEQGLISV
jgi:predicted transcriptional regulator